MNLKEAELLLSKHDISFELQEYENEKEYWHHISLFLDTKKAKSCKVISIVIRSNNGYKDFELQFNEDNGDLCFDLIDSEDVFLGKVLKSKKQYEIYDWNSYKCIIK